MGKYVTSTCSAEPQTWGTEEDAVRNVDKVKPTKEWGDRDH